MEKIKLLLYATKSKPYLFSHFKTKFFTNKKEIYANSKALSLNGKIVAECDFEVEKIRADWGSNHIGNIEIDDRYDYYVNSLKDEYELCKKSCLTMEELDDYLKGKNGKAIFIKNLNIFDKPRELNEYSKRIGNDFQVLGNAPQNMMKCCEIKYMVEDCILISIRPEYLVRILNKEKTIEVRKKVLKEMVK